MGSKDVRKPPILASEVFSISSASLETDPPAGRAINLLKGLEEKVGGTECLLAYCTDSLVATFRLIF